MFVGDRRWLPLGWPARPLWLELLQGHCTGEATGTSSLHRAMRVPWIRHTSMEVSVLL